MSDPATPANGKCARARCKKRRPKLAGDDPFCSTACCRSYHGVVMTGDTAAPRRNKR